MTRTDDLLATLTVGEPIADDAPKGTAPNAPLGTFNVSGVAAAYARLQKDETRQVLGKPKVSVTFALSSSGLVDVSKAEAAIEMLEKYEDFEMVPDPNATANATDGEEAKEGEEAAAAADGEAAAAEGTEAANA